MERLSHEDSTGAGTEGPPESLPRPQAPISPARNSTVDLSGLIKISDEAQFLREAYRLVLRRECDPTGFAHFEGLLRRKVPKSVVLHRLANSQEAKDTGNRYVGIWTPLGPSVLWHRIGETLRAAGEALLARLRRVAWTLLNLEVLDRRSQTILERLDAVEDVLLSRTPRGRDQTQIELNAAEPTNVRFTDALANPKWPVLHVGDRLIVTKVDTLIMALPAEEVRLTSLLTFCGTLEQGLTMLFKNVVRERMTVIDVGTNVGTYTLIAASQVGSGGAVWGFEPTPRSFDICKLNLELNNLQGRARIIRAAVSDRAGRAKLRLFDIAGDNTLFGAYDDDRDAVEVETVTLDECIAPGTRVDVVKIDASGAEPLILRGMRRVIEDNPGIRIFVHFAPQHLERAGVEPGDFVEEIERMGFQIASIDDSSGDVRPMTRADLLASDTVHLSLQKDNEGLEWWRRR
jgi:FkbM family methyltransferase